MDVKDLLGKAITYTDYLKTGMSLFHVSKIRHETGQSLVTGYPGQHHPHTVYYLLDPGTELLANPDYRARRNTELLFEQVREIRYPYLPSRSSALFASTSVEAAMFWRSRESRNKGFVYELRLSSNSILTLVDLVWYNYTVRLYKGDPISKQRVLCPNGTLHDELAAVADAYWSGAATDNARIEVLIDGTATISAEVGSQA